jgi:hypothetical protein
VDETQGSALVQHARRELELVGEDPETVEGLCRVVQAFADMGHSGGSASVAVPMLERLLRFQALMPLTDDPGEWEDRSEISGYPLWQNRRDSRFFSIDGGRTNYQAEGASRG